MTSPAMAKRLRSSVRANFTLYEQIVQKDLENACELMATTRVDRAETRSRFPTALATVQRTEQPFHYQLVITRAYQEGEAELLDDIDDDDGMSLSVQCTKF